MKEITVQELKELKDSGEDFELIDVRKLEEFEHCQIGGKLIPMDVIPERYPEIPKDKKVIVHCKKGGRSARVIEWLQVNFGYDNLYNLKGGILEWSEEIDPSVPQY